MFGGLRDTLGLRCSAHAAGIGLYSFFLAGRFFRYLSGIPFMFREFRNRFCLRCSAHAAGVGLYSLFLACCFFRYFSSIPLVIGAFIIYGNCRIFAFG